MGESVAYRDDLEAALQRAADLERELADVRARNLELEALVPQEARQNKHRLELALVREDAERTRQQLEVLEREHALLKRQRPEMPALEREVREKLEGFSRAVITVSAYMLFTALVAASDGGWLAASTIAAIGAVLAGVAGFATLRGARRLLRSGDATAG